MNRNQMAVIPTGLILSDHDGKHKIFLLEV